MFISSSEAKAQLPQMTQTAQMTQSLSVLWILNKLFTGVFMRQDQEQEIMITIDEHVVFMAFQKTNYSLAFPWSKNIMDEHHVFFTFTFVCENTWRIQRSYAHENYKKTMQAVYYCFHRAGKQWTSNTFSWHSPLVILWGKCLENATFARLGKL